MSSYQSMQTTDVELKPGECSLVSFKNQQGEVLFEVKFDGDPSYPHAQVLSDPHTILLIQNLNV
jgi:hypothetical protein